MRALLLIAWVEACCAADSGRIDSAGYLWDDAGWAVAMYD